MAVGLSTSLEMEQVRVNNVKSAIENALASQRFSMAY
jgi:hypothetical protein